MRKIDTRSFVRATRTTAREINRQITLNLVREHQPISRADLARRLNVGRGMVTALVDALLAENAIYEGAAGVAPRGRKPTMLYVRTRDRLAIAVDVRFSRTDVLLSDFAGTAIARESFPTVIDPEALVRELARRIARLLADHQALGRCEGVGLVVPGIVDPRTGCVLHAPQLGWRDVAIRDALSQAVGLPVHVENAPIACALSQMWFGVRGGEAPRNFVYATVSDGVGAGIVVNGEVVRGHAHTAGEFGHLPVHLDGPRCLCGARGCLEVYTSNLATLARYLGHAPAPTAMRGWLEGTELTIEDVVARARAGEPRAVTAVTATARYLGVGLSMLITTLSPALIIVGGEITGVWDQVLPTLQATIAERVLTPAAAQTPITPEPPDSYPRLRGGTTLVAAPEFAAPHVA